MDPYVSIKMYSNKTYRAPRRSPNIKSPNKKVLTIKVLLYKSPKSCQKIGLRAVLTACHKRQVIKNIELVKVVRFA